MKTFTSKAVTIKDIAKQVGVSTATVSRAINNPERLRPETLRRVLDAVRELHFHRNDQARGLKVNKSRLVGIMIPDILNPFFARVVRGVESVFDQNDFTTIICDSEENPAMELRYLSRLFERRIQGLVIIPALEKSEVIGRISGSRLPAVYVDRYLSNECDSVKCNNLGGVSLLVSQLVEAGCARIGAIAGPLTTLPGRERFNAFSQTMQGHGLHVPGPWVRVSDFSIEGGYREMMALLNAPDRPDGVVVQNNMMAIGALRAIRELGLRIPQDVAVAVFDEVSLADLLNPALTIVVQPAEEMGRAAAQLLLDRIAGNRSLPVQELVFEPRLILGGSSGLRQGRESTAREKGGESDTT